MPVCPLEYRYGREEMKAIFSEKSKLQSYLDVEAALVRAHAAVGAVPAEAAEAVEKAADIDAVGIERIREIERETKHDIMAVVKAMAEAAGEHGGYIHLGATSNDIVDTANALQHKKAIALLKDDLRGLEMVLIGLAKQHKDTIMTGRTHGQFAIPLPFGLKMAVYAAETHRHLERLRECEGRVCVGKMMGAVGTGAALGPRALDIQDKVMAELGIGIEEAPSQLVGRDRYAEFVAVLANIAASLEKFATEVRNLQRTELAEVAESFDKEKQVGSSTMAHKKNPITSENICGLARVARAFVIPSYENVVLWHERDLTNSSAERFTLSHACVLVDDILVKSIDVFGNLHVDPGRMMANFETGKGLQMGEAVMMALTAKGMGRQEAHEVVRRTAMAAYEGAETLRELLLNEESVTSLLSPEELDGALDPTAYMGVSGEIIDRVARLIEDG